MSSHLRSMKRHIRHQRRKQHHQTRRKQWKAHCLHRQRQKRPAPTYDQWLKRNDPKEYQRRKERQEQQTRT